MKNKSLISLQFAFIILFGCASIPKETYHINSGNDQTEIGFATLYLGSAYRVIIDDKYFVDSRKYGSVALPAGEHKIKWAREFGVSVMIEPSGFAAYETISQARLEAGHNYELKADRTTGPGYRVYLWVEDTATGKVIDGRKKS